MNKKIQLLLLTGSSLAFQTHAGDINFSGFATIAGGVTMGSDENYGGYDDKISFATNSLVGLQASSDLGEGWGVTTQLLAKGEEDWDLSAKWAFISYDTSNDWRILFGRQRAPFYIYSDYLDVSYAYHWITPPEGVYSLPFDVIDGIGAIKNLTLGSFDSTFHVTMGGNKSEISGFDAEFKDVISIAWSLNKDWFTARLSYAVADFSLDSPDITTLADGWRAAMFPEIATGVEIVEDKGKFAGVGFTFDFENWLIVTEVTKVETGENFYPTSDSYYMSIGYRLGNGLLHLTAGADEADPDISLLDDVPVGVVPELDFLYASTVGIFNNGAEDSSFVTLGYKWDMDATVSMKVEYTNFDNKLMGANDASLLQFAITTVF
ncbi:hypothetical protein [uncultured Paraglaciecola sp.]|uniref:hypothetical protein n=1 Tax=uncultured Paraglaciecola sp. TaxID=1765024 RepID=UPI00262BF0A1|nr:hypothetical protein [uncultured Paraglaciecola sp.]